MRRENKDADTNTSSKQYKISLSKEDVNMLIRNGYTLEARTNGQFVTKKTYMFINKLIEGLKRKEYFTNNF